MAKKLPTYTMPFKRREEGRTNYKKRLKLLLSKKPRLVVRKSLRHITAQIVNFGAKGDVTLASANSQELKKLGWSFSSDSLPAAYLVGLLAGKRAKEKKIEEAVLDSGLYASVKGSRVYAAVRGAIDAGLKVPAADEVFPDESRISGEHIRAHRKIENLPNTFKSVKQKILGG